MPPITEASFRLAFGLILGSGLVMGFILRSRGGYVRNNAVARQAEGRLFWLRAVGALGYLPSIFIYLSAPSLLSWSHIPLPASVRWIGAGIALSMMVVLFWVFSTLGKNITDTVITRDGATLVTRGPYRLVRHPLYTFGALAHLGLIVLSSSWLLLAWVGLLLLYIGIRTPKEERNLIERFGDDYVRYAQRTGRYLPKLTGARG